MAPAAVTRTAVGKAASSCAVAGWMSSTTNPPSDFELGKWIVPCAGSTESARTRGYTKGVVSSSSASVVLYWPSGSCVPSRSESSTVMVKGVEGDGRLAMLSVNGFHSGLRDEWIVSDRYNN